jgi:ribose transport system substrate-binding protein
MDNFERMEESMKKLEKVLAGSIILMLTVTMFAWSAGGQAGGPKADKDIVIAVVPKALDNMIFLDAKTGATNKGKQLGIKVEWVGPARSDAAEQVNVIESLIERRVDGILISCNNADALKDVIDRAVDAGIKVACFDSDSPNSKRAFYAGTDNYAFGQQAADYMIQYLPQGGKVAILTGVLGAPNLEERIKGFRDRLAEKKSPIQVLPVQTGEDDVQKSVEVVTQFTTANPDLAGWFFDGGWPYFADPAALPEVRNFMRRGGHIVSIDTAYPMLQYLGEDMVDVLIGQNYIKMGEDGVEMLYKLIKGQDAGIPANKIYFTGSEIGTKDNWRQLRSGKDPW